jgi:hypothetical protein
LGKQRGGSAGRTAGSGIGKERNWGLIVAVAAVVAVLGIFAVVVVVDLTSGGASGPPSGVEEFGVEQGHTEGEVEYAQSPPAGGEHNPVWQNAGFYSEPISDENAVHTLEHGAVWITYSPDLPQGQQDRIRDLVSDQECMVASPYEGLDAPVVASAWGLQLRLEEAGDPDLERFIRAYRQGPQAPEPGAACTGGVGQPS